MDPGFLTGAGIQVATSLAGRGVAVFGPVPRGLPHLGLPALGWHDAAAPTGTAVSLFVCLHVSRRYFGPGKVRAARRQPAW
jgi:hypothetical protein